MVDLDLIGKKELEREFAEGRGRNDEDDDDDDAFDEEDFDVGDDDGAEIEEGDVRDATTDYLEQIAQAEVRRARKHTNGAWTLTVVQSQIRRALENGGGDADSVASSVWSDEVLWISPLDSIDVYAHFTSVLTGLESSNPALFQLATQSLDAGARAELEAIGARAMKGGEKADAVPPQF